VIKGSAEALIKVWYFLFISQAENEFLGICKFHHVSCFKQLVKCIPRTRWTAEFAFRGHRNILVVTLSPRRVLLLALLCNNEA